MNKDIDYMFVSNTNNAVQRHPVVFRGMTPLNQRKKVGVTFYDIFLRTEWLKRNIATCSQFYSWTFQNSEYVLEVTVHSKFLLN